MINKLILLNCLIFLAIPYSIVKNSRQVRPRNCPNSSGYNV